MFQILAGAFLLPFALLCLDAVGVLRLPGVVERGCYFVAGVGLTAGAVLFGPRFLAYLFGR